LTWPSWIQSTHFNLVVHCRDLHIKSTGQSKIHAMQKSNWIFWLNRRGPTSRAYRSTTVANHMDKFIKINFSRLIFHVYDVWELHARRMLNYKGIIHYSPSTHAFGYNWSLYSNQHLVYKVHVSFKTTCHVSTKSFLHPVLKWKCIMSHLSIMLHLCIFLQNPRFFPRNNFPAMTL
jgi:hypothetical protein